MAQESTQTQKKTDSKQWSEQSKQLAIELRERVKSLIPDLFSSEDVTGFLDVVRKFPQYTFQNLLLIHARLPNATCIAAFNIWAEILGTNEYAAVLRPEAYKKGIPILYPFTDYSDLKTSGVKLIWHVTNMWDISQVKIDRNPFEPNIFVQDQDHLPLLLETATAILGTDYSYRVIYDNQLKYKNIPGYVSDNIIRVRSDMSDIDKLHFLTETICSTHTPCGSLSRRTYNLLIQSICHCLFKIFELPKPSIPALPRRGFKIVSESEQTVFLNVLQHSVFEMYQRFAGIYVTFRTEPSEPLEGFDDLFQIP